jgi:hypothetical protein
MKSIPLSFPGQEEILDYLADAHRFTRDDDYLRRSGASQVAARVFAGKRMPSIEIDGHLYVALHREGFGIRDFAKVTSLGALKEALIDCAVEHRANRVRPGPDAPDLKTESSESAHTSEVAQVS